MNPPRQALERARRVVIKIGSRLLATQPDLISKIADQIAAADAESRRQFLIVSSGAISIGAQRLGYQQRPRQMAKLQAAAAVGQGELMRRYADAFARHGRVVAQVLLTHSDLASRRRLINAQQALEALFEAGAVAIVNENDTVSTDEISVGDNDQLASMVVPLVRADALLLLTDVDGVLDDTGQRIAVMDEHQVIGDVKNTADHGTGGMPSKVQAAVKASHSGASVVIGPAGVPDSIRRMLSGEDLGTLFPPHGNTLRARQHWIAYTLKPRGVVLLNEGAARAVREQGRSLLPVGVIGVRGRFGPGDAIRLVDPDGTEVGRGLARVGVLEVARMAGLTSAELANQVGSADPVVVHRDDLVVR